MNSDEVEISLLDGTKYIGKLSRVSEEKIEISDKSVGEVEIDFSEIKKGKTLLKW
jgi:ribosome maturation factor RimP